MKYEEVGCYLEINVATGNIERVALDPEVMREHLGRSDIGIREACGGFCQHSMQTCLRIEK
ncbi:ferredoxin [Geotalea sp. SG265]|uniref:ferredoxin n=1 Tax=Geotalea sp. SG265 TaxID=2922867 RepID=UPI001FAF4F5E|nr:ferredoxin [Geotalea sp. SG265]